MHEVVNEETTGRCVKQASKMWCAQNEVMNADARRMRSSAMREYSETSCTRPTAHGNPEDETKEKPEKEYKANDCRREGIVGVSSNHRGETGPEFKTAMLFRLSFNVISFAFVTQPAFSWMPGDDRWVRKVPVNTFVVLTPCTP